MKCPLGSPDVDGPGRSSRQPDRRRRCGGSPDEQKAQPIRQDTVWAETVKRGIEEPGRYGAANLFDGDAATSYCSAPGDGLGRVSVGLSDADAVWLPKLTGVRITPSPATPAGRFEAWFYYPAAAGFGGGRAEGAVGSNASTLAIEKRDLGPNGAAITIYLRGDDPRHDRGPFCLAEMRGGRQLIRTVPP